MNAKVNVLPEFRNDSRGNLASAYESGLAKIFSYNGSDVTFRKDDGVVYVNATEMAKRFGKAPGKWIELPSAQEFIKTLSVIRKLDNGGIQTVRGGISGGGATWMHEDVAMEFARWLSPEFAIWCNDRIKELLLTGTVSINRGDSIVRVKTPKEYLECSIMVAEAVQKLLKVSDASVAGIINRAAMNIGAEQLDYVPSNGVKFSATDLLKKLGRMETIYQFNAKMEERGLLETKERTSRSSKTGKKKFKALTETGLEYGDNEVSPNNPNETQPRYFEHKFKELLDLIFE